MQRPAETKLALVPATVHTAGVDDANATAKVEVAVAVSAIGDALNGWLAIAPNAMVWLPLLTVSVNACVAAGGVPVAVIVNGNVPATFGVPESTPAGVNVTAGVPAGSVPAVTANVGEFVAMTVNVPGTPTVKVVEATLVNTGGPGDGVKELLVPGALANPPAFVAVTEQVVGVPLTSPVMTRTSVVVPALASVPAVGLHVAV